MGRDGHVFFSRHPAAPKTDKLSIKRHRRLRNEFDESIDYREETARSGVGVPAAVSKSRARFRFTWSNSLVVSRGGRPDFRGGGGGSAGPLPCAWGGVEKPAGTSSSLGRCSVTVVSPMLKLLLCAIF